MKLRSHARVDAELEAAFDWYRLRSDDAGFDLLREYRLALQRILEFPTAWTKINDTTRRCQLDRFPYALLYKINESRREIVVTRFYHMHQRPTKWRRG